MSSPFFSLFLSLSLQKCVSLRSQMGMVEERTGFVSEGRRKHNQMRAPPFPPRPRLPPLQRARYAYRHKRVLAEFYHAGLHMQHRNKMNRSNQLPVAPVTTRGKASSEPCFPRVKSSKLTVDLRMGRFVLVESRPVFKLIPMNRDSNSLAAPSCLISLSHPPRSLYSLTASLRSGSVAKGATRRRIYRMQGLGEWESPDKSLEAWSAATAMDGAGHTEAWD